MHDGLELARARVAQDRRHRRRPLTGQDGGIHGRASKPAWRAFGPRDTFAVVRDAGRGWDDDNALRLGAALSFYAVLAFPPILVVAISIAGLLFGRDVAAEGLHRQLSGAPWPERKPDVPGDDPDRLEAQEGLLAAGLALLVLLFGATGVFVELRDALNLIWKVPSAAASSEGS